MKTFASFAAFLLLTASTTAAAQSAEPATAPSAATATADAAAGGPTFHLDVEVDPTAYVLNGYSLHVGLGLDRFRLDLGAYAIGMPEAFHGNEGFDASMHGFGAKLHWFAFDEQKGGFVGVGAGVGKTLVSLRDTHLATEVTSFSAGFEAGWRFDLGAGFYATPWVSLDYGFDAKDVQLGGETFATDEWSVFPAVHFGRRFL